MEGTKANDVWQLDLTSNTWTCLDVGTHRLNLAKPDDSKPCPRVGMTASYYGGDLYMLNGADEDNDKCNDMWKFNVASKTWTKTEPKGDFPVGRQGSTMGIMDDKMVMFGGIIEVTKESDEVFVFDFVTQEWKLMDLNSDQMDGTVQRRDSRAFSNA